MGAPPQPARPFCRMAASMAFLFTLGARGSPLALAQAHEARSRLAAALEPAPADDGGGEVLGPRGAIIARSP